jgi:hypothetical protein
MRSALTVIAVGAAAMTIAAPLRAEERPAARLVYLRGKNTESCPPESAVREAVGVRLGYDPFSSYAASTMFAEIAATEGGFTASLKLVDPDSSVRGDRVLRVQGRCAELIDAIALTMSLAIDPMSATREGPVPGLPPAEKEVAVPAAAAPPDPGPAPSPDAPAERPAPPAERVRLSAALGPLVSLGTAPGAALGAALEARAELGRWFVGLGGRADLSSSAPAAGLGRVASSLVAGSLGVGAREGWISAGAAAYLGRLSASGLELREPREQDALFLAAGVRVGVAIPLSARVEARGHVELLANLLRHTLAISGSQAYEYPVGSGNAALAIAVRFL